MEHGKVSRDFVTMSQWCDRWSQMVMSQVIVTVCHMTRVTWGLWESKHIAIVVKYISSRELSENSIKFSLSNSKQRDSWLNSSHRTLDADTGRGRGKCMAKRKGMPEGSDLPSRGRLCCHCRTTTAQKLGEKLLASFISFFWQGDKPHWSPAFDQKAMCLLFAQGNSRDLSTMQGIGKRNGGICCWWRKSLWEVRGLWNTLYFSKFAVSISLNCFFFFFLLTLVVMWLHVLSVPRPRQHANLLTWIRHKQRQGWKQSEGQEQGGQNNKWM